MSQSLDKRIWFKIIFLPLRESLTLVAGLGGRRVLFPFHHMLKSPLGSCEILRQIFQNLSLFVFVLLERQEVNNYLTFLTKFSSPFFEGDCKICG